MSSSLTIYTRYQLLTLYKIVQNDTATQNKGKIVFKRLNSSYKTARIPTDRCLFVPTVGLVQEVIAFVIFWISISKWGLYENKMSRKRNNTAHKYTVYTCNILLTRGQRARVCGHAWQVREHCKDFYIVWCLKKKYYSSLFKIGITSLNKPTRVWHINIHLRIVYQ